MAINFKKWWDSFFNTKTPPPTPVATTRQVGVNIPAGAQGVLHTDAGWTYTGRADATGRLVYTIPIGVTGGGTLDVTFEGYVPWSDRVILDPELHSPVFMTAVSTDVDPSGIPLREIARIRGAMWTVPGPWSLGPRPGQRDNVTSLGQIMAHPPAEQQKMIDTYKGYGYTHCVAGPPGGPGDGYHGMWPGMPDMSGVAGFELFLDYLQRFWNNGLCPVVFLHFDNASFDETVATFDHLIRGNARAQRLIRIVVPSGWEPTKYDWSNATWTKYASWARELLPNALVLIHTVSDVDAPVGTDALGDDNGKDNAAGWRNIAPHIHGWLTQSSAFESPDKKGGDGRYPERTNFENWQSQFNITDDKSYANRFVNGYAGWPTNSAWGDGKPLMVYAAEYCSYWITNQRRTYAEGVTWGDAAMRAGADGYLDSGSVDVPVPKSLR